MEETLTTEQLFGKSTEPPKTTEELFSGKSDFSPMEMVKNIPKSGLEFAKSVGTAIIHPIETAKTLGKTALGGVEKLVPGKQESEQSFDALTNFFKERYGGTENVKKTIQNDPVGFLADLSTVLGVGGAAIGKAGTASKLGLIEKAGSAISKAGEVTEPFRAATTIAKPIAKFAGNRIAESVGLTSGVGGDVVKEAFNAPRETIPQMRGKVPDMDIVAKAKEGLEAVKENRRNEYLSKFEKLKTNPTNFENAVLDVKQKLNNKLGQFGIKIAQDGTPDFSRSVLSKGGQASVEEAINTIKSWGNQEDDVTAVGLDTLKRKLDDLIPETGAAKAFITPLKKEVKNAIGKAIPDYYEMTKNYEEASNNIRDIEKALSLGGKAGADTSLRKLTQVLRQNFELRKDLVKQLSDASGENILPQIAGQQLSTFEPRGLMRGVAPVAGGSIGTLIYKGLLNPAYLATFAAASPRIVGEFATALGLGKEYANRLMFQAHKYKLDNPTLIKGSFQAGRVKREVTK